MDNKKHALLIYNDFSGQSETKDKLQSVFPHIANEFSIVTTICTETEKDIENAFQSLQPYDAVFLIGGDGTIHRCIQYLCKHENIPPIGILPAGTCNDFARTLSIPMNLEEAAIQLVNGNTRQIDVAKMNEGYFLNFAGIGLIVDASQNIDEQLKERFGKLSYFISTIKKVRESEMFSFSLQTDNETIEDEAVMILVCNGFSIGSVPLPYEKIDPSDGHLDVFVLKETNYQLLRKVLFSNDILDENLTYLDHYEVTSCTITTKEKKEIDTDGESHFQTPCSIELLPNRLSFFVPTPI